MKIVVRGTNWIGDAVMTIPAMRELRRIFPDARITLHTRAWAEGIFRDADFLDEILTFEKTESSLLEVVQQGQMLREKNFDIAVLFPNSFASALTARYGRIKRRFGYSRDARRFFLTDPVRIPKWKNRRHESYYYLNLVAEIEAAMLGSETVMSRTPSIDLGVSESRRQRAREILAENSVDLSRKTVALGVGSTNSKAKRWGVESYARLNDRLQTEAGVNVLLIGSNDEIEVSNLVAGMSVSKPIILTGRTNLEEATAILSEIDLLISNDTGLAHVAPAVGTKTLVIFGPTNPETTAPLSPVAHVIRKDVECSPCMLRDCPIDHRCMTRISPDEVFIRATALLADKWTTPIS